MKNRLSGNTRINMQSISLPTIHNPLVDSFQRTHRSLRISVTDRCNIRCQYCMPAGLVQFLPRSQLLSYEQIAMLVRTLVPVGITRLRLTGGEPLVRANLDTLVKLLVSIPGVESIAMTTNAMLLAEQIDGLYEAGLRNINISLDTLRNDVFKNLTRREGLDKVLHGIEAAVERGLKPKLNAVLLRDINLDDAVELVEFALQRNLTMRFIEYMPLDADGSWDGTQMIAGKELRSILEKRFGKLTLSERDDPSRPSSDYILEGRSGTVGFIDSVSQPFCGACDRLRVTAEGLMRNCLFGKEEWDLRPFLQGDFDPEGLIEKVRECVARKFAAHGIGTQGFVAPERTMHRIGG
jgi:cyclic pyranopterin phosphate synthase